MSASTRPSRTSPPASQAAFGSFGAPSATSGPKILRPADSTMTLIDGDAGPPPMLLSDGSAHTLQPLPPATAPNALHGATPRGFSRHRLHPSPALLAGAPAAPGAHAASPGSPQIGIDISYDASYGSEDAVMTHAPPPPPPPPPAAAPSSSSLSDGGWRPARAITYGHAGNAPRSGFTPHSSTASWQASADAAAAAGATGADAAGPAPTSFLAKLAQLSHVPSTLALTPSRHASMLPPPVGRADSDSDSMHDDTSDGGRDARETATDPEEEASEIVIRRDLLGALDGPDASAVGMASMATARADDHDHDHDHDRFDLDATLELGPDRQAAPFRRSTSGPSDPLRDRPTPPPPHHHHDPQQEDSAMELASDQPVLDSPPLPAKHAVRHTPDRERLLQRGRDARDAPPPPAMPDLPAHPVAHHSAPVTERPAWLRRGSPTTGRSSPDPAVASALSGAAARPRDHRGAATPHAPLPATHAPRPATSSPLPSVPSVPSVPSTRRASPAMATLRATSVDGGLDRDAAAGPSSGVVPASSPSVLAPHLAARPRVSPRTLSSTALLGLGYGHAQPRSPSLTATTTAADPGEAREAAPRADGRPVAGSSAGLGAGAGAGAGAGSPRMGAALPAAVDPRHATPLSLATSSSTPAPTLRSTQTSMTPVAPVSTADVWLSPAVPGAHVFTQADLDAVRREVTAQFEKQLDFAQLEATALVEKEKASAAVVADMRGVLTEWEGAMMAMIKEKEGLVAENDRLRVQLQRMTERHQQEQQEHQLAQTKLKRLHADFEASRAREAELRHTVDQTAAHLQSTETRYIALKNQAEAKLEAASAEIARVQATAAAEREERLAGLEKERAALRAKMSRLEIANAGLEKSIQTKAEENLELTRICDSLLAQIDGTA
ncbi:hypothetical protein CXG81DRAFT_27591 [Caulochytrium protostelioides]|uniref:Transforming acidic coiled-coil-containing protein C-terminal domain-containing protein n=1 Tax=Caulochytrium protostelioides TaxID=1555241 RepID=A0A4P9X3R1_9FUNG|nr:hypothetical protein CXG81DRAFT_27591 [Caulochytrium protostelioides]|eukprot:RKO99660.1 hypothetical protein CXG81DRAFT_27591 [Caulochytrium protostelioides]